MQVVVSEVMQHLDQDKFGGFWRRVLAQFIDGLILYIPTAIAEITLHQWMYGPLEESQKIDLIPKAIAIFVVWAAYEIPFWSSRWQATLGKKCCGMVVTTWNGDRLSLWQAVGRYLCKCVSGTIIIGCLFIPFTRYRQALHDLMASTLVPRRGALKRLSQV